MKCKVRFGIFENRKIFPGVTFVRNVCQSKSHLMCFKNLCSKTELAYLIGCQPRFLKISSKWFSLWQPIK